MIQTLRVKTIQSGKLMKWRLSKNVLSADEHYM